MIPGFCFCFFNICTLKLFYVFFYFLLLLLNSKFLLVIIFIFILSSEISAKSKRKILVKPCSNNFFLGDQNLGQFSCMVQNALKKIQIHLAATLYRKPL